MGFFKNNKSKKSSEEDKKDGLPTLPSLPDLPNSRNGKKPLEGSSKNTTLPSFPNSQFGEKMNQNTVKDAVVDPRENKRMEIPPVHSNPSKSRTPPSAMNPSIMSRPPMPPRKIQGRSKPRSLEMSDWSPPEVKNVKSAEPLFIKLDTFEKAISSFNEIKLRVGEVETLLRNIRELKTQEDRELNDWENEIETIKARLEQIDHEIFERME